MNALLLCFALLLSTGWTNAPLSPEERTMLQPFEVIVFADDGMTIISHITYTPLAGKVTRSNWL